MKELLKAYVNSCEKMPEEQIKLLSDDLLYSYFLRRLREKGKFYPEEKKLFEKFFDKNADEKMQYYLLTKGVEFSFFNNPNEDAYFNYILSYIKNIGSSLYDAVDDKNLFNFEKLINSGKVVLSQEKKYFFVLSLKIYCSNSHNLKPNKSRITIKEIIPEELQVALLNEFEFDIEQLLENNVYFSDEVIRDIINKQLVDNCKEEDMGDNILIFPYLIKRYGKIPDYVIKMILDFDCQSQSAFDYLRNGIENLFKYNQKNVKKYLKSMIHLLKNKAIENPSYFNKSDFESYEEFISWLND